MSRFASGRWERLFMATQYQGSPLGLLLNPFYLARKGLYQSIAELAPQLGGRLLDVGCGRKPYEHLFQTTEYVGLEIETTEHRERKKADFYYDGHRFPFEDGSFDSVIANEVFEHVFEPQEFLSEVSRVLRPNGRLLLTLPFVWDEHEQPYDFARYSSFGIRHVLEHHGFSVLEARKTASDVRALAQLLNGYIYKVVGRPGSLARTALAVALTSPVNLVGAVLGPLLPKNPDLFLDNVVLAEKRS